MQEFLESHPELLLPDFEHVVAKPNLGGERQPDFAFAVRSGGGVEWHFVEIESPSKRIFTSGEEFQFRSEFTQAKGQLLQWDVLLTRDASFFERRLPGLFKARYHLIYGRDSELDDPRRQMLAVEFSETARRNFHTVDDIANRFSRMISRVFS